LSAKKVRQVDEQVSVRQETGLTCFPRDLDRCAVPSPVLESAREADREGHHQLTLVEYGEDALKIRIHMIRAASRYIDLQNFILRGDETGKLVLNELLAAARRGVKVRLLLDQMFSFSDVEYLVHLTMAHSNFEIRFYNPSFYKAKMQNHDWINGMACCFRRVNQRMHNKAMIVDNQAAILGGRNIGDEYMGLHTAFNFHDLDVLCIGPVARQASEVFDIYWNSDWVMPVSALKLPTTQAERNDARVQLSRRLAETPSLERFSIAPRSWSAEIAALPGHLHIGKSRVETDVPESGAIRQEMIEVIYGLTMSARHELLIVNAYIIPAERAIGSLRTLKERGVTTKILTNSLASHDVPAVNSHYKQWRKPLLESGVELYEMRHDAAIKPVVADTPPTHSEFMGLHSKAMVVDRERCYIGSMNFDPRSVNINSEMGVIVESRGLCDALAKLIERDTQPANSWQVQLDVAGDLRWVTEGEVVTRQPARDWWQRVEDVIFMTFPKEVY